MPLSILFWACLALSLLMVDSFIIYYIAPSKVPKPLSSIVYLFLTCLGWAVFYHLTHT